MKKIFFSLILVLAPFSIHAHDSTIQKNRPADIVNLHDIDPTIRTEMRYITSHNFLGRPVKGYHRPICYLSAPAAKALKKVQKELSQKHQLSLKVYDCYRPQTAVNDFVTWAKDLKDQKMKAEFYPEVDKTKLFANGYIAERSGHSRASTLDLTIIGLDMGTAYDFFDPLAHTTNRKIKGIAKKNRKLLKSLMEKNGFVNYDQEWWHYTLKNEAYPNTYFDFPVR